MQYYPKADGEKAALWAAPITVGNVMEWNVLECVGMCWNVHAAPIPVVGT